MLYNINHLKNKIKILIKNIAYKLSNMWYNIYV